MIHKDMTIEEILTSFPQRSQMLAQEMMNAGLNCVGCGASVWETLEAGMLGHGFGEAGAGVYDDGALDGKRWPRGGTQGLSGV